MRLVGLGGDSSQVTIVHRGESWSVMVVDGCVSQIKSGHNMFDCPRNLIFLE